MRRRIVFIASIAVGVCLYIYSAPDGKVVAPPVPTTLIPPDYPPIAREKLVKLDERYGRIKMLGGVAAVRQAILDDAVSFQKLEEFQMFVLEWIDIAGWDDYADLMVAVAETGTANIRRNAAALLSGRPTPLLRQNGCESRIVRLHISETDPAAAADWKDRSRMVRR